jgi:hypothetical protein
MPESLSPEFRQVQTSAPVAVIVWFGLNGQASPAEPPISESHKGGIAKLVQ